MAISARTPACGAPEGASAAGPVGLSPSCLARAPATTVWVTGLYDAVQDPVSPELALVDPELARRERAGLYDPAGFRPGWRTAPPGPVVDRSITAFVRDAALERTADPSIVGSSSALLPASEPMQPRVVAPARALAATVPRRAVRRGGRILLGAAAALAIGAGLAFSLQTGSPEKAVIVNAPEKAVIVNAPAAVPPVEAPMAPPSRQTAPVRHVAAVPKKPARDVKTLAWAPVKGALGYEVQLFRGSERVLVKRTPEARLNLPRSWKYEGRVVVRRRGTYLWYVWPLMPGNRRAAAAIVQARIVIDTSA